MDQKINAIICATTLIQDNNISGAEEIISKEYPFVPIRSEERKYSVLEMMQQFFRDGFIDRYSGNRLINPGMLRILSEFMPDAFPYQSHWKTDKCHIAYWEIQPTIDHIQPISLGGKDAPENWATTSMVHNSVKSNYTLEQLGWTLKDGGDIHKWNGLSIEFVSLVENNPCLKQINRIKSYYEATKKVLKQYDLNK